MKTTIEKIEELDERIKTERRKAERLASERARLVDYIADKARRAGKLLELRARLIADIEKGFAS